MAKAPQPGRCKTRLVPPLTPEQAACLSAAFLRDVTENLALAARRQAIAPSIAYAPAGCAHLFDGLVADGTGFVLADGSLPPPPGVAGFGRCLLHAVTTLVGDGFASVCVLNSDSPTLPTGLLEQAASILAMPGERAVMAPAEDGGYTLLGMKAARAALFTDIDWSTDRVADQTRARANAIGLQLVELPRWYDVDDAASLCRLRRDLANGTGFAAPASARALAAIDAEAAAATGPMQPGFSEMGVVA
jgi:rSAM/selenodomain-associated transferase 1